MAMSMIDAGPEGDENARKKVENNTITIDTIAPRARYIILFVLLLVLLLLLFMYILCRVCDL